MDFLNHILSSINIVSNSVGGVLLAPVSMVPGWLSITLISVILGVLLLIVFKYTSNQKAIALIRADIKANLLAIRLFRDSTLVPLKAQVNLMAASFKLLFHSAVPMMVMIVPVSLILAQMGLWYQARPLTAGEEDVVVKLELNDKSETFPEVMLESMPAAEIILGPVRILSRKEVYWKIRPLEDGFHNLTFMVGDQIYNKSIAVGSSLMRLSPKRPGLKFMDRLLYPLEKPFKTDSIVQSISINYPVRDSHVYGTGWWILYLFVVSLISAFIIKPLINVKV